MTQDPAGPPTRRVPPVLIGTVAAVATSVAVTATTPLGQAFGDSITPTSAAVIGTVRLEGDGAPVGGAVVSTGARTVRSGPDGAFALPDITRGKHTIRVQHVAVEEGVIPFVVPRRAESVDVGTVAVRPAYAVKHETRAFNSAFWIEGGPEALQRLRGATYRFPDGWRTPPAQARGPGSFCVVVFDRFWSTEAELDVSADVELDRRGLEVSGSTSAARRPQDCPAGQPEVPSVVGVAEQEARQRLAAAGLPLVAVAGTEVSCPDQVGTVLGSSPDAGWPWPADRDVQLTVGVASGLLEMALTSSAPDRFFC